MKLLSFSAGLSGPWRPSLYDNVASSSSNCLNSVATFSDSLILTLIFLILSLVVSYDLKSW
ncbi:hypothetical protein [Mycoplasma tauri]|uniref:hypothetical protein n=1 Tax=Mycoplasma tauri TaxID=547987 RepID=UPI001CC0C351|nr:hypothetical protein [Mycoplasma tauri]MBZ4226933.1 hypothetical protein [Mycoplasma tauri]